MMCLSSRFDSVCHALPRSIRRTGLAGAMKGGEFVRRLVADPAERDRPAAVAAEHLGVADDRAETSAAERHP